MMGPSRGGSGGDPLLGVLKVRFFVENFLWLPNIDMVSCFNVQILTPERYNEHLRHFRIEVLTPHPTPPGKKAALASRNKY